MKTSILNESAFPRDVQPRGDEPGVNNTTAMPRIHCSRWWRIGAIALVAAIAAWAIGRESASRVERNDIEVSSRRRPPLPEFPKASRTTDNNNALMRLGRVGNPDGTAVAYGAEANNLISGEHFRTDFVLDELAGLLKVPVNSIADPNKPGEINPDAPLFRAQAGTLTEKGKQVTRKMRQRQLLEGKPPHIVFTDWVLTNHSFTLNKLKHPNDQEKAVLSAIAQSAAEMMPKPGDRIRAVAVNRGELEDDRMALSAGMLPVEPPQQAADTALANQ
jgi:hypothetical protein